MAEPARAAVVDTANHRMVARDSRSMMMLRPPLPGERLTDEQALSMAAWLVAMVDPVPGGDVRARFDVMLRAIQGT